MEQQHTSFQKFFSEKIRKHSILAFPLQWLGLKGPLTSTLGNAYKERKRMRAINKEIR